MKKLLLLLLGLLLLSCEQPTITKVVEIVPDTPESNEIPIDDPSFDTDNIKFAIYDGETLRLWDGQRTYDLYQGVITKAGDKIFSLGDVLSYFDDEGTIIKTKILPTETPSATLSVKKSASSRSATVYEDDVYTLVVMDPAEAAALGARYKEYTRIYVNGEEVGKWYEHEFGVLDVYHTLSGHVLIKKSPNGDFYNLTDDTEIYTAIDEGLIFHDWGTEGGYIWDETGDHYVTWDYNYFDNSRYLYANGKWYTENGYEYYNGVVYSEVNILSMFNRHADYPDWYTEDTEYASTPSILPVGVIEENGEDVLYYVECVTATLYKFIPSINQVKTLVQLYLPPYNKTDAAIYMRTLNPEILDGDVYYHLDDSVKRYDIETGLITTFSDEQELLEW